VVELLAAAVQDGWRPAETEWQSWFERLPTDARPAVERLRDSLRAQAESNLSRLERYEALLTGGSAARGREIFFGTRVACSACHSIGPRGGKVGPDLTRIGAIRSGRDLLESIIVPSASFAQGYDSYRIATEGAEELTGIIARQSPDAIVLRSVSGAEVQVPRNRIQQITRSTISLMPEGLEQGMTRDEFRDLLSFLQSLKTPDPVEAR